MINRMYRRCRMVVAVCGWSREVVVEIVEVRGELGRIPPRTSLPAEPPLIVRIDVSIASQ